jgi:hypothetical protein
MNRPHDRPSSRCLLQLRGVFKLFTVSDKALCVQHCRLIYDSAPQTETSARTSDGAIQTLFATASRITKCISIYEIESL